MLPVAFALVIGCIWSIQDVGSRCPLLSVALRHKRLILLVEVNELLKFKVALKKTYPLTD